MSMSPWLAVTLFGLAVFGFAWMTPRLREPEGGSDPAYDRLLEELETENRELLEAISKFKEEQDRTIQNLVNQLEELERQMKTAAEQNTSVSVPSPAISAANAPEGNAGAALLAGSESAARETAGGAEAYEQESSKATVTDEQPMEPSRHAPPSIRERYAELLNLHSKGKSVEQIAKLAGMNKGEVQLILQLAKREEEQLA